MDYSIVYDPTVFVRDSIEAAALTPAMQAVKTPVHNDLELVRAIDAFAAEPNGAVLVLPTTPNIPLVIR